MIVVNCDTSQYRAKLKGGTDSRENRILVTVILHPDNAMF